MRRRRAIVIAVLLTAAEAGFLRARTGKFAGKVVVRCREGHEFETTWIPGFSLNSLRLGPWRVQRCPVGRHWSIVTPVRTTRTPAPTAPR
jgi:hypothetical protein